MNKHLLLIAFTTAFASSEIKAAAESDPHVLPYVADWVDEALAKWPVTVDQLRAHPAYKNEYEEHLAPEQHINRADIRLVHFLRGRKLARAQANCDFIRQSPHENAPNLSALRQNEIDYTLRDRIQYREEKIARRTKLNPRFADIRTSKEYKDTLIATQDETIKAKTRGRFMPDRHYGDLCDQAEQYIQEKQCEPAQALIDFLFSSTYLSVCKAQDDYLKVLNEAQQENNKALEMRAHAAAE